MSSPSTASRSRRRISWARPKATASSSSWRPSNPPASRPPRGRPAWPRKPSSSASPMPKAAIQFGKPIYDFPRVYGKLAWMAVETMIARQLTYHAARQKDFDKRCDIEAGPGQAPRRPRRLGQCRQRPPGPWRQRLRRGIRHQPRPLRRPHPQHLRGRRRDPGPGHRPGAAGGKELKGGLTSTSFAYSLKSMSWRRLPSSGKSETDCRFPAEAVSRRSEGRGRMPVDSL